jgi:hypothetical protein
MNRRVLLVAALAVLLGGCGQLGGSSSFAPRAVTPPPVPSPPPAAPPVRLGPDELPVSVAIGYARRDADRRRAELAKARRSTTVAGALRRALLSRQITQGEHDRLRGEYGAARESLAQLSGLRRAELGAVLANVDALAASHRLTTSRFAPVFLVLRRNREYWTRVASFPAPHDRTTFGRDPAVFQYYPGQGMQLQQLASWGRVNARLGLCLGGGRCPRARLRAALDRLVRLGARREGFVAWEYYFSFAGGMPPWISGMTQGTAIQALARGSRVLRRGARYRALAVRALGAFRAPPPVGVSVPAPGGRHYLMYSFSPGLRILNGDLQAITGLRDLAVLGRSRSARVLFRRGELAARRAVGRFDTGAWSLYSQDGRESSLGYHQLVSQFLGNLCRRTDRRTYCAANRRFVRYEHEPPRIGIARMAGVRARRPVALSFSLSKLATVDVKVTSRRGVALDQQLSLERGSHALAWVPPSRGRYRVRVVAQGPSGPRGVQRESVRVVLPKPKPKPKKKPKPKAEPKRHR